MSEKPLRVGLLMESYRTRAWTRLMLRRIVESDFARVELVVLAERRAEPSRRRAGWRFPSQKTLLGAYLRLDRALFPCRPDALARCDTADLLHDVPVLRVEPRSTTFSDRLAPEDIARLKEHDLDVLVRIGFRILRGDVLRAARHGVWSYHHGDNRVMRGGPAGLWPVLEGRPLTGCTVQILNEDLDNGLVLFRSTGTTHRLSVHRNRNALYWKSAAFLPRLLRQLHREGPRAFFRRVRHANRHPAFYANRLFTTRELTPLRTAGLLARHWLRYLLLRAPSLRFRHQWVLLYRFGPELGTSFHRFKALVPSSDRFWADPQIVPRDGRYYVFIEEYLYATRRGHIAMLEIRPDGTHTAPSPVLIRPYHLSHPFLFEWEGALYMIPESAVRRTIDVYRCDEFPNRWSHHATLMEDVHAVDTVLLRHGGAWWLFTNMAETEGASTWDELFLFRADHPLSNAWQPHPLNPIVSDASRARPAGPFIEREGRLYRPSQDCSRGYGTGLRLSEVVELSETAYREVEVSAAVPNWDRRIVGLHTFAAAGELTCADALRRRPRWRP